MRRLLSILPLVLGLPLRALATPVECPGCVLGLFADSAMTRTQVEASGESVPIYLGIRYGAGAAQDLTGIEFSIANLDSFLVQVTPFPPLAIVIGTPAAPAPIDTLYHTGGMNVAWSECLRGDRPLLKLVLRPRGVWPPATVLRVKRRYPATVDRATTPILTRCDEPFYTAEALQGGRLLLGPGGTPQCSVTTPRFDFGPVAEGATPTIPVTVTNTGGGLLEGVATIAGQDFTLDPADHGFILAHAESKVFTVRFTPSAPGPRSCNVSFAAGCDPLVFTGHLVDVIPIAALYAGADSLVGHFVTIEGQVTIPSNPANSVTEAWVQDASGRGLRAVLGLVGRSECAGHDRIVHLGGVFERTTYGFQVSHVTNARVLSSLNPEVSPLRISIAEAARPDHISTYVELIGTVSLVPSGVAITDSTGTLRVGPILGAIAGLTAIVRAVPEIDAAGPFLHLYDYVETYGCELRSVWGTRDATVLGDSAEASVRIGYNPEPFSSWRVRVTFDPRIVRLLSVRVAPLLAGWAHFAVESRTDSSVVISASNPVPLPRHTYSDLTLLKFQVIGCTPLGTNLGITLLDGDLEGVTTCDGAVFCWNCRPTGDVNGDLALTPGDARCTLLTFLGGGTVAPECDVAGFCEVTTGDVNCDFHTTPSDALEIFERWLAGEAPRAKCATKAGDAPLGAEPGIAAPIRSPGSFRLDVSNGREEGNGEFALGLERLAPAGPAAVGVEIRFDSARLQFLGLRKEPAGNQWNALEVGSPGIGRVRIGGFDARQATAASPQTDPIALLLARLVFRGDRHGLEAAQVEWLDETAPDLIASDHIRLGIPRPNPIVSGSVVLDFALPVAQTVVATVLDVRGRRVKTLGNGILAPGQHAVHWDCTDAQSQRVAAGLYVIVVRIGSIVQRHKVIVVN